MGTRSGNIRDSHENVWDSYGKQEGFTLASNEKYVGNERDSHGKHTRNARVPHRRQLGMLWDSCGK